MIKFENTEVVGWEHAIRGMRNPMNSWEKSDSSKCGSYDMDCDYCKRNMYKCGIFCGKFYIGDNDLDLMKRLRNAGTDHRKFMRMITVYVDITAPMYWWSEFDTYKIGTVANSTSKMHKMLAKPFEMNDFSFDKLPGYKNEVGQYIPDFDYDKEEWREIAKTGYEVSNLGRIRRGDRILAGSYHSDGYIFTTIKGTQIPIHRFVANAFIPNPDNLPEVNHKDGNKMNNSVENLEWVTRSENQKHAVEMGLQPKGLSTYKGKFTEEQREKIKNLWNSGKYSRREMARMYGVSHTCINDIINNKYQYATKVNIFETVARPTVDTLNELRDYWLRETNEKKKKKIWYSILQLLPVSYNQKRTVMLNYEVLANIYKSRRNHRLDEWSEHGTVFAETENGPKSYTEEGFGFCDWIKTLPYSELITGPSLTDIPICHEIMEEAKKRVKQSQQCSEEVLKKVEQRIRMREESEEFFKKLREEAEKEGIR